MRNKKFEIMCKGSMKGLSLIETLVSMAVLLVVAAAAFTGLEYYMRSYSANQLRAGIQMGSGSALELMAQEIGQAGLLNFAPRLLTTAVTASPTEQAVALDSMDSIFVGETLLIGNGADQETVTVAEVNTAESKITALFKKDHVANTDVNAIGVFPQGIVSSSTGTELRLFGDTTGNGTLVYVTYTCDTVNGRLLRSATPVTPESVSASAPVTLISNIVPSPGGTPCFQYAPPTTIEGFTFITSVAVTITVGTTSIDPQTGHFFTMTRPVLNVSPRNILSGQNLAMAGYTARLQALPPNIPLI